MQKINKLFEADAVLAGDKPLTEYRHLKILKFNLNIIGAWPRDGKNKYFKYIGLIHVTMLLINWFLHTHYLYLNTKYLSLNDLGHLFLTTFVCSVSTARGFLTYPESTKFKGLTKMLLTTMHLHYFKDVSDYAAKTYKRIHRISHFYCLGLTIEMYICIMTFNLMPIWNNYTSGNFKEKILHNTTYEHAIYYTLPLKQDTHFYPYLAYTIFNVHMSNLTSIEVCMLDLLLSLMAFNLWGHCKILIHDIGSFPLPARRTTDVSSSSNSVTLNVEMYSEEEQKMVSEKLKQCINYHRLIKDYTNTMSAAIGPIFLIYYLFHQVSGCILLLECSQMTTESLLKYLPLSIIIFQQLIQLSSIFELIGTTSEKFKDAVYGLPWVYMDTKNRKTVAIFLMNVQEPIHVKALGVVDVGVSTMATILKTALSYFTFLRSIK